MDVHPGLVNGSVYLDYNATTPTDPRVAAAAQPYLGVEFGKPASSHHYAATPARAVQTARKQTAALIGATADTIVFAASGSEANSSPPPSPRS